MIYAKEQILALARRIADEFKPLRVVLFGSYAYGQPRGDSDLDLLVVMRFKGNAFDFATKILDQVSAPCGVDLLVRRPIEAARAYQEFDPLIREALDHGKVLYESDRSPMGAQGRRGFHERSSRISRSQGAQPRQRMLSRAAVR